MLSNLSSKIPFSRGDMKEFDCVIFGASGFTGKRVVEEMGRVGGRLQWAIAGRSEAKLNQVLGEAAQYCGKDLSNIPIIIADVSDEESLVSMARRTRLVLNTVGPFRLYGEAVVKACVENGTSHIDVSGEPIYLEKMQLNYNDTAKKMGAYVVGSCGWDSIPYDLGVVYTMQQFPGELNYVEGVFRPHSAPGYKINYGTFESMIYGFAHKDELRPIRKQLLKDPLPKSDFKMPKRKSFFQHEGTGGWCVPFLGADRSVGVRTQHNFYHERKRRPVQLQAFMQFSSYFWGVMGIIWGMFFGLMANFSFGRKLMMKFPGIFSCGLFSKKGPTRKQMEESSFDYSFFGRGWRTREGADGEHSEGPSYRIQTNVHGPDMGYLSTAILCVASALTILEDSNRLPPGGGVFSPGVAFENSRLLDRLEARGITFSVVSNDLGPAK